MRVNAIIELEGKGEKKGMKTRKRSELCGRLQSVMILRLSVDSGTKTDQDASDKAHFDVQYVLSPAPPAYKASNMNRVCRRAMHDTDNKVDGGKDEIETG